MKFLPFLKLRKTKMRNTKGLLRTDLSFKTKAKIRGKKEREKCFKIRINCREEVENQFFIPFLENTRNILCNNELTSRYCKGLYKS